MGKTYSWLYSDQCRLVSRLNGLYCHCIHVLIADHEIKDIKEINLKIYVKQSSKNWIFQYKMKKQLKYLASMHMDKFAVLL